MRSSIHIQGRNADVDAGTEDLISAGGTYAFPTQARVHDLVSGSADDDEGGTGAEKVTVEGLDADGEFQSEEVTLDGTNGVATTNSYTAIHRMYVSQVGSGGVNAGNITATADTDATVTRRIAAGEGQDTDGVYRVPAGYKLHLVHWYGAIIGTVGTKLAELQLHVRSASADGWRIAARMGLQGGAINSHEQALQETVAAGGDVKIVAVSQQADADCYGFFRGHLRRSV